MDDPIGQGKAAFICGLIEGRHAFGVMKRPGRQRPASSIETGEGSGQGTSFLGAEIPFLSIPELFPQKMLRTASFSGQVALVTLHEAWNEANLAKVEPHRIGLIVGGMPIRLTPKVYFAKKKT